MREAQSLCRGGSPHQNEDLLAVLEKLHDPKRVRALLQLWRKS